MPFNENVLTKNFISQPAGCRREASRVGGLAPRAGGGAQWKPFVKALGGTAGRLMDMASRPGLASVLAACCLLALGCSPAAISLLLRSRPGDGGNGRPIFGILAQEIHFKSFQKYGSSYIAASYVKFIESAGARVVPIRLNRSDEEYDTLFHSINGILYPGGGVDLETSEFSRVAKIFYRKALEANDRGDYFPIWGTCLGHELLSYLTSGVNLLTWTNTDNFAFPLNFTKDAKASKMFSDFPDDLLKEMASQPVTSNFHFWSLSVQNFTNNEKLRSFYKILTTNVHSNVEFISTMEAYAYPVYGVQWHPEKNPFEWKNETGIPHSRTAMKVAYYIADFLVNEARKSNHRFSSKKEETEALIYNFNPVFTGKFASFDQTYFFD